MINRTKWFVAFSVIAFLIAAGAYLDGSGAIQSAYSLIENAGSALPMRQTLNFTGGGCSDDPTDHRTNCTGGSTGGGGTGGGITVFSGSSVTLLGTQYLAIGGGAAVSSTETDVEIEAPVAAQVSNLSVQISAALGLATSAVFTWRDGASDQVLTCTISGAMATSCQDNTHSFNAAQGDEIDISVVTTGTPSAVTVVIATQFGSLANLNPTFTISNASSTGTTVNTLTKLTGAPSTAVITATTDTGGAIGITTAGAGTTGTATITTAGKIPCVFDGATTAGDYVQISSSTAGNCHDTGAATYPSSGQVLGRVLSTNGSGGTYTLDLFPSEIKASSGGGGGLSAEGFYLYDGTNYYLPSPSGLLEAALPGVSSFSWITTQGTASVATNGNALTMTVPRTSGDTLRMYGTSLASSTSLTVAVAETSPTTPAGNYVSGGILLYESSSGKLILFGQNFNIGGSPAGCTMNIQVVYWNSSTSYSGTVFQPSGCNMPVSGIQWLQVTISGGNLNFNWSADGISFITLYSAAETAFFTTAPTSWGIGMNGNNDGGSQVVYETLYSYLAQ